MCAGLKVIETIFLHHPILWMRKLSPTERQQMQNSDSRSSALPTWP